MSKQIYRLYLAEYEQIATWMTGGNNAILKYIKPYDMYIVYMTGRAKLPFERYRRILDSMEEQCIFIDARQMSDSELHQHMLNQIDIYANENTHIYFLCNPQDYQALRGQINKGIEISLKSSFRTGKLDLPPDIEQDIKPEKISADILPMSLLEPEGSFHQEKKELSSSDDGEKQSYNLSESVANGNVIKPVDIKSGVEEDKDKKGKYVKDSKPHSIRPRRNKKQRPGAKKPKTGKPISGTEDSGGIGNHISNTPMEAFMTMFGSRIGDDAQRAPSSTPTPEKRSKISSDNKESESSSSQFSKKIDHPTENEHELTERKTSRGGQSNDKQDDDQSGKKTWKERISGRSNENSHSSRSASVIQDIEKAIFGTKQAYAEITKEYTELDDSKARTVSLMSDRLIKDINLLIKDIKKYDFSYDSYMELISTLIRSDNLYDFKEGWSVVHPGCELNLTEQIYTALYKEACHYAKTCEVLYSEDLW